MSAPAREFMKGNEAACMGALAAGCRHYFGYPITPQNDIPEYLSAHLPPLGGSFLQAESEVATINMLLGAASAGKRVMTSSSGPGLSLMQEGISYMAGSELPAVIVNISRSGPGLGGIAPSQGDYFQAVKGGGHGDYRTPVLAPHSVQEMYSLTMDAFDLADRYRTPVVLLADAIMGQMKEPFVPHPYGGKEEPGGKPWALTGCEGRPRQRLKSLHLDEKEIEAHNWALKAKYDRLQAEARHEAYRLEDADVVLVAFGTAARVCKTAIQWARSEGIRAGLLRPVTLFPFPEEAVRDACARSRATLVVEMNTGQMVEDVLRVTPHHDRVRFHGRPCAMPTPERILADILAAGGKG